MKKHYKSNINSEEEKVDEPLATYATKNRIKIYNSFGEEAEDNYKYLASLSAEQHFINAKNLIERVFSKSLQDNKRSSGINFN